MRGVKKFAAERLPQRSVLRDVILQEKDEVDACEFLGKLEVWLFLLRRDDALTSRK